MPKEVKYNDYPWDSVLEQAKQVISEGGLVYQKFTCSGCGNRLTVDSPNTFFTLGTCDNCSVTTDIKEKGCNYMVVLHATRTKP